MGEFFNIQILKENINHEQQGAETELLHLFVKKIFFHRETPILQITKTLSEDQLWKEHNNIKKKTP